MSSTDTVTKNFLGIPVQGDITKSGRAEVEQWGPERLSELLLPAIQHPRVEGIRWHQYTPYFNDGEPCTFRIYMSGVRIEGMGPDGGDYEDGYEEIGYAQDPVLTAAIGKRTMVREAGGHIWKFDPEPEDPELRALLLAASDAIEGGHFENLLLDAFGDHAIVTATRNGFDVEFYEHD